MKEPFLIDDIASLRQRLLKTTRNEGKAGELWHLLKTSARSAPKDFPWFTFFVAVITKEKQDVQNAKEAIYTYLRKLEPMSFCTGLQFHFWCFAFPHAKICLYFQWLCSIDAFTPEEEKAIREQLIIYHFVNFYYGMRSKPDPECIDNQTLSLTLSCTLVGYLFGQGEQASTMAAIMFRDGSRRLPYVIGDMPESGYSGEGSSYMDCVNGPAIPLAVELLERILGEDGLLYKSFTQGGGKSISVLKMVAREFMPGGLLLPWDNYGYQFGVRGAIAYGASKTGLPLFYDVLENKTTWTYDIGTGWVYDDLVWTLIWWPQKILTEAKYEGNWYEPMVGGALVSQDNNHYCMQMWDPSEPNMPARSHVNPNAVIFTGFGVPVSADGSQAREVEHRFWFSDTWRRVSFLEIGSDSSYNYGDGCAGAHSVILVDGLESLRAQSEYPQVLSSQSFASPPALFSDCTPIYQEHFSDIHQVSRKTTLLNNEFFIIEDLFVAEKSHRISARFLFRPEGKVKKHSIKILTKEGISLSLFDLQKKAAITGEVVKNFPMLPDNESFLCDFGWEGDCVRGLYGVLMSQTIIPTREISQLSLIFETGNPWSRGEAETNLATSPYSGSLRLPAYMEQELTNHSTWWYGVTLALQPEETYLQLPSGLIAPKLYLNGQGIDLSAFTTSLALLGPRIPLPASAIKSQSLEFLLCTQVPISHYDGGGDGTIGLTGGLWLCKQAEAEEILDADFDGTTIRITTNQRIFQADYELMSKEGTTDGNI